MTNKVRKKKEVANQLKCTWSSKRYSWYNFVYCLRFWCNFIFIVWFTSSEKPHSQICKYKLKTKQPQRQQNTELNKRHNQTVSSEYLLGSFDGWIVWFKKKINTAKIVNLFSVSVRVEVAYCKLILFIRKIHSSFTN